MPLRRLGACLLAGLFFWAAPLRAGIGLPERLVLLTERIAEAPTDQSLYLRRALIHSDTGEFKLALADVDTAAQFGPVANTYFVRAVVLYRLGQLAQALPLLNQFIAANPTHAEAVMYRARLLRDTGQREAALADYRRHIAMQPEPEPADHLTAAKLMVELAAERRKGYSRRDAVAFLDARIQQLGNAPQLQRYAIELEQQDCRSTQVLARLEQLHPNARRAPVWHLQMAEQHLLRGARDAADAQLTAAKALLDARRPTADKAQLTHRHDFVRALLALPPKATARAQRMDAVQQRFYPSAAARTAATAATEAAPLDWSDFEQADAAPDEGSQKPTAHAHAPLRGFEQPRAAGEHEVPRPFEAVASFYQCLRHPKPASR